MQAFEGGVLSACRGYSIVLWGQAVCWLRYINFFRAIFDNCNQLAYTYRHRQLGLSMIYLVCLINRAFCVYICILIGEAHNTVRYLLVEKCRVLV